METNTPLLMILVVVDLRLRGPRGLGAHETG